MPKPTLDQLKVLLLNPMSRGGELNSKQQASAKAGWETISKIATLYQDEIEKRANNETPKLVEQRFKDIADTAQKLTKQLRILGPHAIDLAQKLSDASRRQARFHSPSRSALKNQPKPQGGMDLLGEINPERIAWLEASGDMWFLDEEPYRYRPGDSSSGFADFIQHQRSRIFELERVSQVARYLEELAKTIKLERSKLGFGNTFPSDPVNPPENFLFRFIGSELRGKGMPITHAKPIGRLIYVWAREIPRDDWPSVEYFGTRALRKAKNWTPPPR